VLRADKMPPGGLSRAFLTRQDCQGPWKPCALQICDPNDCIQPRPLIPRGARSRAQVVVDPALIGRGWEPCASRRGHHPRGAPQFQHPHDPSQDRLTRPSLHVGPRRGGGCVQRLPGPEGSVPTNCLLRPLLSQSESESHLRSDVCDLRVLRVQGHLQQDAFVRGATRDKAKPCREGDGSQVLFAASATACDPAVGCVALFVAPSPESRHVRLLLRIRRGECASAWSGEYIHECPRQGRHLFPRMPGVPDKLCHRTVLVCRAPCRPPRNVLVSAVQGRPAS